MKGLQDKFIRGNPEHASPETFLQFIEQEKPSAEEALIAYVEVRNHFVLDLGQPASDWDKDIKERIEKICGGEENE